MAEYTRFEDMCVITLELVEKVKFHADNLGVSRNALWRDILVGLMGVRIPERKEEMHGKDM